MGPYEMQLMELLDSQEAREDLRAYNELADQIKIEEEEK